MISKCPKEHMYGFRLGEVRHSLADITKVDTLTYRCKKMSHK